MLARLLSVSAWLLQAALSGYYRFASDANATLLGVDMASEAVARRLAENIWIAVGFALIGVALLWKRASSWFLLGSAAWYLVIWYVSGPFMTVGLFGGYQLAWRIARGLHMYAPFAIHDLVVPALVLSSVLLIGFARVRSGRQL
jgi:hypothetical protein